jgi:hypothetical protein
MPLISVVTFLSMIVLIPSYTVLHDSKFSFILSDIHLLDKITLADSLQNPQVVTVVVLFTILYTVMCYFMLYNFSATMSAHEFS